MVRLTTNLRNKKDSAEESGSSRHRFRTIEINKLSKLIAFIDLTIFISDQLKNLLHYTLYIQARQNGVTIRRCCWVNRGKEITD